MGVQLGALGICGRRSCCQGSLPQLHMGSDALGLFIPFKEQPFRTLKGLAPSNLYKQVNLATPSHCHIPETVHHFQCFLLIQFPRDGLAFLIFPSLVAIKCEVGFPNSCCKGKKVRSKRLGSSKDGALGASIAVWAERAPCLWSCFRLPLLNMSGQPSLERRCSSQL